jgi:hypothetical protein
MSTKARNPDTVHGLLGVSHRFSVPVPGGLEGEGVLEGVLADYEVKDGLFGTGTKFNRVCTAAVRCHSPAQRPAASVSYAVQGRAWPALGSSVRGAASQQQGAQRAAHARLI